MTSSASASSKEAKPALGYVLLGNLPRGTGQGLIFAECMKHGDVAKIDYNPDAVDLLNRCHAFITYRSKENAQKAVKQMSKRVCLFGTESENPVEVTLGTADQANAMMQQAAPEVADPPPAAESLHMRDAPRSDMGRPRRFQEGGRARFVDDVDDRYRARRRERSDSRRPPPRRRAYRSRSPRGISPDFDPVLDAPIVPIERKQPARAGSGFDVKDPTSRTAVPTVPTAVALSTAVPSTDSTGARQVTTRGNWVEFSDGKGQSYYGNMLTGEKTYTRPADWNYVGEPRAQLITANPGNPVNVGSIGNSNVYVGSLPFQISEAEFSNMFSPYGSIMSCRVMASKTHAGVYCGFVKFTKVAEAQMAIAAMNGVLVNGRRLQVKQAHQDNLGFDPAILRFNQTGQSGIVRPMGMPQLPSPGMPQLPPHLA